MLLESAFRDGEITPVEDDVIEALGDTWSLWKELVDHSFVELGITDEKWSYYKKVGWSMHLLRKKRRIVYLLPRSGDFVASFVFGDKAVEAINSSNLPSEIIDEINSAPKYGEGRPIRLEVKSGEKLDIVKQLCVIKLSN